ncbi:MAG: tRNA delta(2)-isopentenylpyrophosphate transferase [Flaviaesturariibacter sp.]|nr:tRNA delta(2)-isopentenylpyrophosphate transferase [Flaviaesturariibacter sp.]
MASKKTVIVIAGPTAVGKTALGIAVAKGFGAEIISADSRQCYKELSIGVARPSEAELAEVPHHFIASHSVSEKVNAVTFEQYALEKSARLFKQNEVVVMVGGTGLYIRAFCEGLDVIPEIPGAIRDKIIEDYQVNGLLWLQQMVRDADPAYYDTGENENPQRLMRALEVITATGTSILQFQRGEKLKRDFNIIKIGVELPRPILYSRINHRVDLMMQQGLIDEVKGLLSYKELNALQTVGYRELFEYLDGKNTLDKAVEQLKTNTRHYAKRQLTWFKKDMEYTWFDPSEEDKIKEHLVSALSLYSD